MDQESVIWTRGLQYAALSDTGLRRANNQDALAVLVADSQQTWQQRGHLFLVADGMGAHAAGELASKLAADTVVLTYSKQRDLSPPQALRAAIEDANRQIFDRGQADPDFRGMGTTSTALLLLPAGAIVAHVGDSRAYRLRGNRLEQLTFDHSLVWEMRAASHLSESEVPDYVPKNIITRSLGPGATVKVDLEGPFSVAIGDTFLLCTDGLSGPLENEEIGIILGSMPPSEAVQALVDLANLRGGPDNITVIAAQITGPELATTQHHSAAKAGRVSKGSLHAALWTLSVLLAVAALAAAAAQWWLPAAACLLGSVVAGLSVLVRHQRASGPDTPGSDGMMGKGPYASCTSEANTEFVARLSRIVEELREAAARQNWPVDWSRLDAMLAAGQAAEKSARPAEAVRKYCELVSCMMAQLKLQANSDTQDHTAN